MTILKTNSIFSFSYFTFFKVLVPPPWLTNLNIKYTVLLINALG